MYLLNFFQRLIWCIQSILLISMALYEIFIKKITIEEFVFYITIANTLAMSLENRGFMYTRCKEAVVNIHSNFCKNEGDILRGVKAYSV